MNWILSIFFNIDHTYIAVVEPTPTGLCLQYIDSTEHPVNLEAMNENGSEKASFELKSIIAQFEGKIKKIKITFPAENVIVTQFPAKPDISNQELKRIVSFEIRNSYPHFNYEDFSPILVPFGGTKQALTMMATIIFKKDVEICTEMTKSLGLPISSVDMSQMNAHNACIYNYPEFSDKNIALFGIQSQFADISLMENRKPVFYNLASVGDINNIGKLVEDELKKILKNNKKIDMAFFFGAVMTKEMFTTVWESAMVLGIDARRLNAFRMVKTNLGQREKDYCSRVSHILPPCIGACIEPYHKKIDIY